MDWSRLEHAYSSAAGLPQLFEQVGDPDLADEAWFELWSCLCHQGTVYPASLAALPVLADIATGRRPGEYRQAIALAGRIVVSEGQLHEAGYARAHYPEAIGELHRVTERYLAEGPFEDFEDDESGYLHPLEALMAFEGVPVWSECLLPGLYDVVCPSCSSSLEIDFYGSSPGTRRRDPHRPYGVSISRARP